MSNLNHGCSVNGSGTQWPSYSVSPCPTSAKPPIYGVLLPSSWVPSKTQVFYPLKHRGGPPAVAEATAAVTVANCSLQVYLYVYSLLPASPDPHPSPHPHTHTSCHSSTSLSNRRNHHHISVGPRDQIGIHPHCEGCGWGCGPQPENRHCHSEYLPPYPADQGPPPGSPSGCFIRPLRTIS